MQTSVASSNWQTFRKPLTLFIHFCLFSIVFDSRCYSSRVYLHKLWKISFLSEHKQNLVCLIRYQKIRIPPRKIRQLNHT